MSRPEDETTTTFDDGKEKASENEDVVNAAPATPETEVGMEETSSTLGTAISVSEDHAPPPAENDTDSSGDPTPVIEEKVMEGTVLPPVEMEAESSEEHDPAVEEKAAKDPAPPPVEAEGGDYQKGAIQGPKLRPLSEILSDNEGVFDIDETRVHTREEFVGLLIEKQKRFIAAYSEELDKGVSVDPSVIEALQKAVEKRDELNIKVKKLKERRTSLKAKNKKLRKDFLDLVKLQESLKDRLTEINSLNDFIDREEYKLETEGVDLENERRLMRSIKEAMEKVRHATGGLLPGEIDERLVGISEEMRQNFESIEQAHQEMVGLAEESQVHHNNFVEENKKVREAESRKSFLTRRIKLHEEMAMFWYTQMGNAAAMDASDRQRRVEEIRDSMLKALEEAEKQSSRGAPRDEREPFEADDGHEDSHKEEIPSPEPPIGDDPGQDVEEGSGKEEGSS